MLVRTSWCVSAVSGSLNHPPTLTLAIGYRYYDTTFKERETK